MTVFTNRISIKSKREGDIINISQKISESVLETKLSNGIVTVFVAGATGALTTIEYEPGLAEDLPKILERIAPKKWPYEHTKQRHDDNGHSHIRASLIGPCITVPFINRQLALGTWQQIVFIELDTRSRNRSLICQIVGE